MNIEIVYAERLCDGLDCWWACELWVTEEGTTLAIPATAPENLLQPELQAYFDGIQDRVWDVAVRKGFAPDVLIRLSERLLLIRLVKLILDEINILRAEAGLPPRTLEQLKEALKSG